MTPQTLLTQEEIEALLELVQTRGGADLASALERPAGMAGEDGHEVRRRDFSKPEALPRADFEVLWAEATHAASRISEALRRWLRLDAKAECVAIEPAPFSQFLTALPSPCLVYPLRCGAGSAFAAALQLEPGLALAAVDRVLGGTGRARFAPRVLTSTERLMADRLASMVTVALAEGLEDVFPIDRKPAGDGAATARAARFVPADARVLLLTFAIAGELAETEAQLVLPLAAYPKRNEKSPAAKPAGAPPAVHDVKVDVSVRLGETILPLRELLRLDLGDIVSLDAEAGSAACVEVEGRPVALGRVGSHGEHLAVAIERLKTGTP